MKRSAIIILVIIAVCFLSLVGIALLTIDLTRERLGAGKVAVILLNGSIADDEGSFLMAAGITPKSVRQQLERAREDSSVKAILLKVNSPGGAVGASQEIAQEIKETEKPIVIFMGDMAASGGYYISAPADKIVAKPGTLTGSIGVISQIMDLRGLYEKLGIKLQIVKSGKHKDMYQRELTPEEQELMQELSDELYDQFIEEVAKSRSLDAEKVRELATGELYTGTQAKELGLVDELGGYQDAIDLAAELGEVEEPVVEEYRPKTFFESIFGLSGVQLGKLVRARLLGSDYILLEHLKNSHPSPQYR